MRTKNTYNRVLWRAYAGLRLADNQSVIIDDPRMRFSLIFVCELMRLNGFLVRGGRGGFAENTLNPFYPRRRHEEHLCHRRLLS